MAEAVHHQTNSNIKPMKDTTSTNNRQPLRSSCSIPIHFTSPDHKDESLRAKRTSSHSLNNGHIKDVRSHPRLTRQKQTAIPIIQEPLPSPKTRTSATSQINSECGTKYAGAQAADPYLLVVGEPRKEKKRSLRSKLLRNITGKKLAEVTGRKYSKKFSDSFKKKSVKKQKSSNLTTNVADVDHTENICETRNLPDGTAIINIKDDKDGDTSHIKNENSPTIVYLNNNLSPEIDNDVSYLDDLNCDPRYLNTVVEEESFSISSSDSDLNYEGSESSSGNDIEDSSRLHNLPSAELYMNNSESDEVNVSSNRYARASSDNIESNSKFMDNNYPNQSRIIHRKRKKKRKPSNNDNSGKVSGITKPKINGSPTGPVTDIFINTLDASRATKSLDINLKPGNYKIHLNFADNNGNLINERVIEVTVPNIVDVPNIKDISDPKKSKRTCLGIGPPPSDPEALYYNDSSRKSLSKRVIHLLKPHNNLKDGIRFQKQRSNPCFINLGCPIRASKKEKFRYGYMSCLDIRKHNLNRSSSDSVINDFNVGYEGVEHLKREYSDSVDNHMYSSCIDNSEVYVGNACKIDGQSGKDMFQSNNEILKFPSQSIYSRWEKKWVVTDAFLKNVVDEYFSDSPVFAPVAPIHCSSPARSLFNSYDCLVADDFVNPNYLGKSSQTCYEPGNCNTDSDIFRNSFLSSLNSLNYEADEDDDDIGNDLNNKSRKHNIRYSAKSRRTDAVDSFLGSVPTAGQAYILTRSYDDCEALPEGNMFGTKGSETNEFVKQSLPAPFSVDQSSEVYGGKHKELQCQSEVGKVKSSITLPLVSCVQHSRDSLSYLNLSLTKVKPLQLISFSEDSCSVCEISESSINNLCDPDIVKYSEYCNRASESSNYNFVNSNLVFERSTEPSNYDFVNSNLVFERSAVKQLPTNNFDFFGAIREINRLHEEDSEQDNFLCSIENSNDMEEATRNSSLYSSPYSSCSRPNCDKTNRYEYLLTNSDPTVFENECKKFSNEYINMDHFYSDPKIVREDSYSEYVDSFEPKRRNTSDHSKYLRSRLPGVVPLSSHTSDESREFKSPQYGRKRFSKRFWKPDCDLVSSGETKSDLSDIACEDKHVEENKKSFLTESKWRNPHSKLNRDSYFEKDCKKKKSKRKKSKTRQYISDIISALGNAAPKLRNSFTSSSSSEEKSSCSGTSSSSISSSDSNTYSPKNKENYIKDAIINDTKLSRDYCSSYSLPCEKQCNWRRAYLNHIGCDSSLEDIKKKPRGSIKKNSDPGCTMYQKCSTYAHLNINKNPARVNERMYCNEESKNYDEMLGYTIYDSVENFESFSKSSSCIGDNADCDAWCSSGNMQECRSNHSVSTESVNSEVSSYYTAAPTVHNRTEFHGNQNFISDNIDYKNYRTNGTCLDDSNPPVPIRKRKSNLCSSRPVSSESDFLHQLDEIKLKYFKDENARNLSRREKSSFPPPNPTWNISDDDAHSVLEGEEIFYPSSSEGSCSVSSNNDYTNSEFYNCSGAAYTNIFVDSHEDSKRYPDSDGYRNPGSYNVSENIDVPTQYEWLSRKLVDDEPILYQYAYETFDPGQDIESEICTPGFNYASVAFLPEFDECEDELSDLSFEDIIEVNIPCFHKIDSKQSLGHGKCDWDDSIIVDEPSCREDGADSKNSDYLSTVYSTSPSSVSNENVGSLLDDVVTTLSDKWKLSPPEASFQKSSNILGRPEVSKSFPKACKYSRIGKPPVSPGSRPREVKVVGSIRSQSRLRSMSAGANGCKLRENSVPPIRPSSLIGLPRPTSLSNIEPESISTPSYSSQESLHSGPPTLNFDDRAPQPIW